MMKGSTMAVCTFWQALTIVPLWLPLILFNFFPFILFGVLLLVLTEIYRSNELVSFKAMGISNMKMFKILALFGLLASGFFLALSMSYPYATKLFFKKKNDFNVANFLKSLAPKKVNTFGKYKVFFTDIDKQNVIHNITILNDKKKNNKENNDNGEDKIIFAEKLVLGFNDYNEIIGRGKSVNIVSFNFKDSNSKGGQENEHEEKEKVFFDNGKIKNERNDKLIKNAFYAEDMDVLFDEIFQGKKNYNSAFSYKNRLRQKNILDLLRVKTNNNYEALVKSLEVHGRVINHWFVVISLISVFSLLLRRTSNRRTSSRDLLFIVVFGAYFALNKAFVLESVLERGSFCLYYLHLLVLSVIFIVLLFKSDRKKRI